MQQQFGDNAAASQPGFFQRKDPWGHGLSLWVVALLLFLGPVALAAMSRVTMNNDMETWLPDDDASALEYNWLRRNFPEKEMIVLTWRNSTLSDPRLPILLGKLTGQVEADGVRRGGLPYVDEVIHGGDMLRRMAEFGVPQEEGVRRLEGTLLGRGWLKVRLSEELPQGRQAAIEQLVAGARSQLGLAISIHEACRPWEPTVTERRSFEQLAAEFSGIRPTADDYQPPEFQPHDLQVSWSGMANHPEQQTAFIEFAKSLKSNAGANLVADCYSETGSPIALCVMMSAAGHAEQGKALDAVRQAAMDSLIAADDLSLGGRLVSGVEVNNGVVRSVWNPHADSLWQRSALILSGIVGMFFAFVSLRSIRLGLVVLGISYYTALLGMSLIPLTGGSLNMVLVVLPTLLAVLTLSGAIHIANYWKHAVCEDPRNAVTRATTMARVPCLLAGVTTALGLISLAGSPLTPVRDFGIYASIGTLISIAMVLYGLPALLQMLPAQRTRTGDVDPRNWRAFGRWIGRNAGVALAASLLVSLACAAGLMRFRVETKVITYFPKESRIVTDFEHIEDSLGGVCPVEIVVRFDEFAQKQHGFLERIEIVRGVEEAIRSHSEVSGTVSLADFQPVRMPPGEKATTREKIFFNRRSHETEARAKSGANADVANFLATTSEPPLPSQPPRTGVDELWRINAQCSIIADVNYNQLTADLTQAARDRTRDLAGVDVLVSGTVPLFLRTQGAVLDSLIWSFVMSFAMITLVMIWVLKDAIAGVISMLPNILPVVAVFGLVSWCGQRIDIGTMVTASVALGIAVDGTLHLLTWFQDGLRHGHNRREAVVLALSHCGPAMWQTSAAVGLGLLMLFPADLLLISRFGWLMALLIFAALLGDVILLPSLLVGSLGRLIERGLNRRGELGRTPQLMDAPAPRAPAAKLAQPYDSRYAG